MKVKLATLAAVAFAAAATTAQAQAQDTSIPRPANSGAGVVRADFNNDGFADLAVGIPNEDLTGPGGATLADAGAVQVLYGSPTGPTGPSAQLWTQDSPGVRDAAEANDGFGSALAAGDFNSDGFSDLAVSAPGEDFVTRPSPTTDGGIVNILYGSPSGLVASLTSSPGQTFTQAMLNPSSRLESGDRFGSALTTGDFDGNGFADLAAGTPGEDLATADDGAVDVILGSSSGLVAAGAKFLPGPNQPGASFGAALTGADFGGGPEADLAVGLPRFDVSATADAGEVLVYSGSPTGPSTTGVVVVRQGVNGVPDFSEQNDRFGSVLAAGDVNHDGHADLAIGTPLEDLQKSDESFATDAGSVSILHGASARITAKGAEFWTQDSFSGTHLILDQVESFDHFGASLALGDFNGDGNADLAAGVPGENLTAASVNRDDAGAVNVIYGSSVGLFASGNQLLTQAGYPQPTGGLEAGDAYGSALSAWSFDGDGQADLAIAAPGEDFIRFDERGVTDAGEVDVIRGSLAGLNSTGAQAWTQDNIVGDAAENGDRFGAALY